MPLLPVLACYFSWLEDRFSSRRATTSCWISWVPSKMSRIVQGVLVRTPLQVRRVGLVGMVGFIGAVGGLVRDICGMAGPVHPLP